MDELLKLLPGLEKGGTVLILLYIAYNLKEYINKKDEQISNLIDKFDGIIDKFDHRVKESNEIISKATEMFALIKDKIKNNKL